MEDALKNLILQVEEGKKINMLEKKSYQLKKIV